jgi:hypothetical protein
MINEKKYLTTDINMFYMLIVNSNNVYAGSGAEPQREETGEKHHTSIKTPGGC